MAKWTSGRSERTLNQSAANSRNEPRLYNAASDTSDSLGDDMIKRSAKAEVFQGVVFCLT